MRSVFAATATMAVGGLCVTLRQSHAGKHFVFVLLWALGMLLTPLTRGFVRSLCARRKWWGCPVFIIGEGSSAYRVIDRLQKNPEGGLKPVAIFSEHSHAELRICGLPVFEGLDLVDALGKESKVRRAIVACPDPLGKSSIDLIERKASSLARITFATDLSCPSSLETQTSDISRVLAVEMPRTLLRPDARITKRILDLLLGLPLLLLASPLIAAASLAIKFESDGGVFYGHLRVGRDKRMFKVWKLRSMATNGDQILRQHFAANPAAAEEWRLTQKLQHDPRVTKLGRFLRRSSLDELPQLWNVARGEMSLVGPRPIVEAEIVRYGSLLGHYTQVMPGLTGLWQVSGRNNTTYEERVDLDTYYVRNWSPWLDLYLLSKTFSAVVNKQGAY
jgi:Undecaprenyl-phosphate galactose phosphotransferase WbaP